MGDRRGQDVAAPVAPYHDVRQSERGCESTGCRVRCDQARHTPDLLVPSTRSNEDKAWQFVERTGFETVTPSPPEKVLTARNSVVRLWGVT